MPKRKKYQKLPNGYGSIKFIGKGRRNPYAVHPPVTEFKLNGSPITPKAICYVDSWIKGFAVLTAYKAGTYYPGYEKTLNVTDADDRISAETLSQKILADYSRIKGVQEGKGETFAQVYEKFYKWKYETDKSKTFSKSTRQSTETAYKNSAALHNKFFKELRHDDMQSVLDKCPLRHASLEHIKTLFRQMYEYAEIYELCDKNYAEHLKINKPDDDEHGVPFSIEDLKKLWAVKEDPTAEFLLIICYSGWRIKEFDKLEVNLQENYFRGGMKTAAGKNRIVPIHSAILPLVKHRIKEYGDLSLGSGLTKFRADIRKLIARLSIPEDHTPHDGRHTFSMLCEKYNVRENDRKRMMGHSFGKDITNGVYGHRTLEDLRAEIEKIQIP